MGKRKDKFIKKHLLENENGKEPVYSKIHLEARTPNQRKYLSAIRSNIITICKGPSGSGKTLLPVGFAIQNIMASQPMFKKLIVVRSVREAAGTEGIGALPGEISEKFQPFLEPVIDNLRVLIEDGAIESLLRHKTVEALPIAFARGRSLNDVFVLVDEAENCTSEQVLLLLSRIGHNSKIVLNGDVSQSDLKQGQRSGLEDAIEKLNGMNGVAVCELDHTDILRNPLIAEILYRYGKIDIPDKKDETA